MPIIFAASIFISPAHKIGRTAVKSPDMYFVTMIFARVYGIEWTKITEFCL